MGAANAGTMPLFDCENAKKILADLEKSSTDGQALCNFLTAHADELDLLPPAPPAPLKVVCMLTKHELPATLVALEQHWTGRSYRRALAQDKSVDNPLGYNFEQHAPHVIPHKHMKKHLWCLLTKKPIEKSVRAITNHVNSKKFCRALESWKEGHPYAQSEEADGAFGDKLQQFDDAEMALCDKEAQESALDEAELALCEEEVCSSVPTQCVNSVRQKRRDKLRKQAAAAADKPP